VDAVDHLKLVVAWHQLNKGKRYGEGWGAVGNEEKEEINGCHTSGGRSSNSVLLSGTGNVDTKEAKHH
jgi:hypothetical protein